MFCPHFKLENRECLGTCSNCPYGFTPFPPESIKLYVIMSHVPYEFDEIEGIFSTPELAQSCMEKLKKTSDTRSWTVDIWELNQVGKR